MFLVNRLSALIWLHALAVYGGSLCVAVVDPSGGELSGITVNVREAGGRENTGFGKVTDRVGKACFEELKDGRYDVTLEASGFITLVYRSVGVDVLRPVIINAHMAFGDIIELEISENIRISGVIEAASGTGYRPTVCLVTANGIRSHCVTTDRYGQYGIVAKPGRYRLAVMIADKIRYQSPLRDFAAGRLRDVIPRNIALIP